MTRLLSQRDIAPLVAIIDCIEAVETAFRRCATGALQPPASLGVRGNGGTFHVKAAHAGVFAAKINANFPANPSSHALPAIQGVIVVMDAERGSVLGILDSALITTLRTAAATAVAARRLARTGARTAAVIGCGTLGRATIDALCAVHDLHTLRLFDCDPQARDRCARDVANATGRAIVTTASVDEAADGADIVATCTPSRQPFLRARHARAGMFIAATGADNPDKSEIAPDLMARARVVPDLRAQAASMGDLHHAIAAGTLTIDAVHGELGEILAGTAPGRRNEDEIFLFDSTGTALQDVAVAEIVMERARAAGAGLEIAFA